MADLADVENALVAQLAAALFAQNLVTEGGTLIVTETGSIISTEGGVGYLAGALAASTAFWAWPATVSGAPGTAAAGSVRLYRGWPNSAGLNADLMSGYAHVSVFPEPGMGRNTTRYAPIWSVPNPVACTLLASVSGAAVTFSGTPSAGQTVGIQLGYPQTMVQTTPGGTTVATYLVKAGDTLTLVAAGIAAQIAGATSSGPVATMPSSLVDCFIGQPQTAALLTRQQQQAFRISCWCPSPAARDALCAVVDQAMATIEMAGRFSTPDGSNCRLMYVGTYPDDKPAKDRVWRRDFRYTVEYPTTQIAVQPQMTAGILNTAATGPRSS